LPTDREEAERDDIVDREIALGEGGQKFASDIAGCADHRLR